MRILLVDKGTHRSAQVYSVDSIRMYQKEDEYHGEMLGILQIWSDGEEVALPYWFDLKRLETNARGLDDMMKNGYGFFEVDGGYGW